MRMMSRKSTSMVYHRPECRYAQRINKSNRCQMRRDMAEWKGYRPCKCCNSTSFMYRLEEEELEYFAEQHDMDIDLQNNCIYVRTDVGCWKILYTKGSQKFILLHRNYVSGRIGLEEVEDIPYHRQGDMPEAYSIMKYVKYIKKHDEFKKNPPADYRTMPRDTKRQKSFYRTAKRRAERASAKRLDALFVMIEQREGIKSLSYC